MRLQCRSGLEICLVKHSDSAWALRRHNGKRVFIRLKKRHESLREFIIDMQQQVLKNHQPEVDNGTRH